ncbi:MAG TPA: ATP-binding protein [Gaiellaceae bacterium]
MADLSDARALRELVAAQESDTVERKRTADSTTLAKVVSAFANTRGGWLLLGVDDDGTVPGWRPKGTAHPRDWLRDVLENVLDPLPHFEAELFEMDGITIGVVRVPRSSAKPHFIDRTGEVFERRNGQTRRLNGRQVREMTQQGTAGMDAALARFDHRERALDVAMTLDAPRESTAMHARAFASIVRISVAEPSDVLREWVHSTEALSRSHAFVWSAARALNDRDWCTPGEPPPPRTTAGGHAATSEWDSRILKEAKVAWDRAGLGGVRFAGERPDDSGIFYLLSGQARDHWLVIALEYLFGCLANAAVFGPAAVRWDLYGIRGADVTTVRDRNVVAAQGVIPAHYNNMIAIDTEVDLGTTSADGAATKLWQRLERLSGAQHYSGC